MDSKKSDLRDEKSAESSAGDRRAGGTGSVGERPDLAGSGDRSGARSKSRKHAIEGEIADDTGNDPGLGG